jgi:hypothetical protein
MVMKIDTTTNAVTVIAANPDDQINGQSGPTSAKVISSPFDCQTYLSDGQGWWVINVV